MKKSIEQVRQELKDIEERIKEQEIHIADMTQSAAKANMDHRIGIITAWDLVRALRFCKRQLNKCMRRRSRLDKQRIKLIIKLREMGDTQ